MPLTSRGSRRSTSRTRRGNSLALKLGQHINIRPRERPRAGERIGHTVTANIRLAGRGSTRRAEQLTREARGLDGGSHVGEEVPLGEHVGAVADLEGVVGVVVPVVVDGVQVGVALDLGRAAAGLVQVVALQGDLVAGAVQVDVPVVVVVAGGRVVGFAVDVVVGEGDAVAGFGAEDVVLAADAGGSYMVDPDEVGLVDGDGVASPDVLGVDVGDGDVLNDDVLSTADDTKALALDDAGGALADEGLVGVDGDTKRAGIITTCVRTLAEIHMEQRTRSPRQREHSTGSWCTSYPC